MKSFLMSLYLILNVSLIFCQPNQIDKYRNDNYGDIQNRRESLIDGNLVRTLFYNNGEIGQWPFSPSGEWPKGSGQGYLDGMALLVAAEISTDNGIVHSLSTSYREWMDSDPVNGTLWGFEPISGYSNPSSNSIAISNNPNTWPSYWPTVLPGVDSSWGGYWYGYFGKSVFNADLESFFVMDDSQDKEFARPPFNYYPIPSDKNRGGLGLRVEVRNFAWTNFLVEDILFTQYDIINLSDFDYDKTVTGFYIDSGVGGSSDSPDDIAEAIPNELVYCYDYDGMGFPDGWKTGYIGFAFLETAANSTNGIDDDNDGMIDESKNDDIDNDNDWVPFSDQNNNSVWDNGEPLNNDVGSDGIGPDNEFYAGPDNGEGDGFPTHGEPNFDWTDYDEADFIGLTSTSIYRLGGGGTGGGWPKDDEQMWLRLQPSNFDTSLQVANISLTMGSGLYPLPSGYIQRISSAIIFGEDIVDLIHNKDIAEELYKNNYNFSTLVAVEDNTKPIVNNFYLSQNYPNPFNPITSIEYSVPYNEFISLKVYDIIGNELATLVNEHKEAGIYKVNFNASNLASGLYIYKIQAGNFSQVRKMMLLK